MEPLSYILTSINLIFVLVYLIPKLKKLRVGLFITLVLINALVFFKVQMSLLLIILLSTLVFEFLLIKIEFPNFKIKKFEGKAYYFQSLVLFIILFLIGSLSYISEKFEINWDLVNINMTTKDLALVFFIIYLSINNLIGRKKWN